MKTKTLTIVMEVDPLDFDLVERSDVGQILRDALGAFMHARGAAKAPRVADRACSVDPALVEPYVRERYSEQPEFFRTRKVREVSKRCACAMALLRASVTVLADKTPPAEISLLGTPAVEGEWNIYVWLKDDGSKTCCVGHAADKNAALKLARDADAEQIQFGLDGEVVPAK